MGLSSMVPLKAGYFWPTWLTNMVLRVLLSYVLWNTQRLQAIHLRLENCAKWWTRSVWYVCMWLKTQPKNKTGETRVSTSLGKGSNWSPGGCHVYLCRCWGGGCWRWRVPVPVVHRCTDRCRGCITVSWRRRSRCRGNSRGRTWLMAFRSVGAVALTTPTSGHTENTKLISML